MLHHHSSSFSMWKRSTLAYFLLFIILVPHPPLVAICIPSTRSCRSVKFVAPRWIYIKVVVGSDLKDTTIPHSMLSRLIQDRAGNCTESDTHLLACFSVLLWGCGIFTTWKYLKHARSSTAPAPWPMVLRMLLAKNPLGSQTS
ncbi:hypothetical protein BGY98DRAFT_506289 [Russula aff. rugulosa BPL654]|nr:hypothetical protein BGY98DRAFT_506289 [Russula aff. rugulosa BPL654]